jgi:tetratricopeptide (TPR) repeat protein
MIALLLVQLLAANGGSPASRAGQLTGLANEDYEHKRYTDAAQEYQQADRLAPKAGLLLKIAQCYEKAGDLPKATDAYRAYLRRAPFAANKAAIKRTIAHLTKQMKQGQDSLALVPLSPGGPALEPLAPASSGPALEPLALPPAPTEPPPPQAAAPTPPPPVEEASAEGPHKPLAPILVTTGGAVAVAAAAASAYWGGWGLDALSTAQTNQKNAAPAYKGRYNSEIGTYELQAGVWLSIAAVLAAGGIYMLVVGPSWGAASASSSSSVSVAPMPGGGGVTWSGTFP